MAIIVLLEAWLNGENPGRSVKIAGTQGQDGRGKLGGGGGASAKVKEWERAPHINSEVFIWPEGKKGKECDRRGAKRETEKKERKEKEKKRRRKRNKKRERKIERNEEKKEIEKEVD